MFGTQDALTDAGRLISSASKRNAKYIRSLNRYFYNGYRKDSIWSQDTYPMGYWTAANPNQMLADLGTQPNLNLVRSCIDTVKSKLSQTKPLPNFTPIKGTWKTRKVCKNTQIYFDDFFQTQKIYRKGLASALDAMLFEYGVAWVDDEAKEVVRLAPWEFSYDPAEYNFGGIRRANISRRDYPLGFLTSLLKKAEKGIGTKWLEALAADPSRKVEFNIYYNLNEKKAWKFIETDCIEVRALPFDCPPFVLLWYWPPIKGWGSASMADSLMPIQEQVDVIANTLHEALELNPANAIFIPEPVGSANGTSIKKSEFSNQIGNIYPYTAFPGMPGTPVQVSTPAPIDPMYIQLLDKFIGFAYQMEGVSQLSAQSKKPAGLNSGVALDTLENVESERFNAWLQDYIHFFVDIADICIKVFPEGDDILPNRMGRANIKWRDIVKERDSFNLQTSPVSNLSRDPQTKMEQVQKLVSMQIIKPEMAASLLEFADVEKAYSIASASYDDCQKIIERAIEKHDFAFYEVVNMTQLFSEAANTLMSLDADDEDPKVMANLVDFIKDLKGKLDAVTAATAPPPPPMVPNPAPQPPPMVQEAAPMVAPPGLPPG
jgi:hypothetical protein